MPFVDREPEMALLRRLHGEPGARLLVLYGRRRVGKTELLREFCSRHRSIFFVADQQMSGAMASWNRPRPTTPGGPYTEPGFLGVRRWLEAQS